MEVEGWFLSIEWRLQACEQCLGGIALVQDHSFHLGVQLVQQDYFGEDAEQAAEQSLVRGALLGVRDHHRVPEQILVPKHRVNFRRNRW